MPRDLASLMRLWTAPLPSDDATALRAFAEFYTDPVLVLLAIAVAILFVF